MMRHFSLVFEEKLSLSTEVYEDTQLWPNLMTKTSVKLIFLSQLKLSMVNLNIKSCNGKHVSIYLASKNGNFGSKDSCRNPNSVLLVGWKQEVLIRKRKGQLHELTKRKKEFSVGTYKLGYSGFYMDWLLTVSSENPQPCLMIMISILPLVSA